MEKLTALLDGDILLYEVGFAAEVAQDGIPSFDVVKDMVDSRIQNICALAGAHYPPVVYLTGTGNFRYHIAKRQPYKQRAGNKPFHYKNIKAYLKGKYDAISSDGLEADDLIAIHQTSSPNETIVCSRDKDLFSFPGWKYSWELGKQPQRGPLLVTESGCLQFDDERKELKGEGDFFFYAQCLMGDPVDSIPGLPKTGPKKAFDVLSTATCREEALNRVLGMYEKVYGDLAKKELLEQARLLYMIRYIKDNKILLWGFPNDEYEEWYDIDTREIERTPKLQP